MASPLVMARLDRATGHGTAIGGAALSVVYRGHSRNSVPLPMARSRACHDAARTSRWVNRSADPVYIAAAGGRTFMNGAVPRNRPSRLTTASLLLRQQNAPRPYPDTRAASIAAPGAWVK